MSANGKAKNVLVTGADGFIGSHLAESLVRQGYNVTALCCYNSQGSWGWLDHSELATNMEIVLGDVRDPAFCRHIMSGIDVVFHLAALIAIPYSYHAPQSYVETNITGTLNICQAALSEGCERVIHTSTSEVYGTALYVPIDEKHPMQPQSPYSASKIGADALAMSFHNSFEMPLTIARPFNTFGPRQSARAVIPTIISQIAAGKTVIQVGDLSPTRDFNYVEDTCSGFLALSTSKESVGKSVNIGSNFEVSIGDTFELIAELMGADVKFNVDAERLRPAGSEVHRLWCDNSRIYALTGFEPKVGFREGVRRTIAWFQDPDNLSRYKVDRYNI